MRRQETQLLSEILGDVLKENRLDTHLYEMQVVECWYKLLGATARKYTTDIFVKEKRLYIKISSSILKNDLMLQRSSLAKRLNEEVGRTVINEIILL